MMRSQLIILAAAATVSVSGAVLAQTASTTPASSTSTVATPMTATPTTSHAGAYDTFSDAAMRQKTSWGNVYKQLQQQGYVTEKNLGQAISSYKHGAVTGTGATVVTTRAATRSS